MAGGAADCQHILREISGLIRVIEAEMNDRSVRSQRGSLVDVSRKLIDVGFVARMLARKLRTLRSEGVQPNYAYVLSHPYLSQYGPLFM